MEPNPKILTKSLLFLLLGRVEEEVINVMDAKIIGHEKLDIIYLINKDKCLVSTILSTRKGTIWDEL